MPIVSKIEIRIPREEVLKVLRHNKETTILDKTTSGLIDHLIEEGKRLAEPKAVYRDFWVKGSTEHAIILQGAGFDLLGASTVHHLWNAEGVTLFVVTIGHGLDKRVQEFTKEGNMSSASVLDAVGSVAVEYLADYINELITENAMHAGYKTTKRFSPGYGDWQLKEQKGLLNLLNAGQIGVTLTSGYQMNPQKSISGVVGWHK